MPNQESESSDDSSPGELRQEMARQSIAKYAKSATTDRKSTRLNSSH